MILSQAWKAYEMDRKLEGYSKHTLNAYRLQVDLLIRHLGDMSISEVTTEDLKGYISKDFDRLARSSIGHRIKSIKALFSWAVDEDYIIKNPTRRLKEPKQGIKVRKMLDREEIEVLKSVCERPIEHALIQMLYSTGIRVGELHTLNINDVSIQNRTIIVNGKGDKERVAFFNAECKVWIHAYLNSRSDNCESLFITERKPYRRSSIDQLRYIIKRIAKRTNIESSVYPHRLRHSLASHMFANDAPLSLIQNILGHSKPETTQVYIHTDPSRTKQLYDRYS